MKKSLFIFMIFLFSQGFSQEIKHIEPPFWWADMHNTQLQILCYGKNLASYDIQVSKGKILNIRKTENPNYLFVLMDTKGVEAGTFDILFLKNKKVKHKEAYQLKKRSKNARFRKSFDASDVVYLLMPDRFSNGNLDNDSQVTMREKANRSFDGGRHGGDIQGIINHLDYLEDLGVTALWSTPLLEDNEPNYSYHTYAQSDYYKIDPRYGNNKDYRRLADALHQRNMKLIMDYVTNHWGSKHWMIKDLPTKDWIHYWANGEKGFQRSNYRMTTQFDPNASRVDAEACMDGWFDTSMPDMNLSNPLLLKYMTQNAIWWIEYAGLDGLRVDTYSYNDKNAISTWTKAIIEEYPHFNIMGEVWMHNQAQIAYWQKDSPVGAIASYNSYLPTVMDFTLHDAMITMFNEDYMGWDKGMMRAYDNFSNDFLYANSMNLLLFVGNHDTTRINEYLQGDFNKYKLAITLLLTTRGIPQLYYADEIGMRGNKEKNGDGDLRKDFPGGWTSDTHNAFEKNGRSILQEKYYNFTRKILQWRKRQPLIHNGKLLQFVPINNMYVYFRMNDTSAIMVIINNNNESQIIDWQRFKEGIRNKKIGKDIISTKQIELSKPYKIAGKTAMIIELK